MAKGRPISEDLRRAIVRMHAVGVSISTISIYTDTSPRQIYCIINRFLTTGKVLTATQRRKTGQTRHLTSDNVSVRILEAVVILITHFSLGIFKDHLIIPAIDILTSCKSDSKRLVDGLCRNLPYGEPSSEADIQ
jgi:hypothetical protein